MVKRILTISMILALLVVMTLPLGVSATNTGTQQASISGQSSSILIVSKNGDSAVSTITFPSGLPGATVSNPHNNIDSTSPQILSASASEPVVKLKNTSDHALKTTIEVSAWSGGVVVSERYELITTGQTQVQSLTQVLSSDGESPHTVSTEKTIASTATADLYLAVVLGNSPTSSGSSTITILGELP